MGVALLDVNVLVALFHAAHVHHDIAHDWFSAHAQAGWASCPFTETALIRILGNPARVDQHVPIPRIVDMLERFCAHTRHEFWHDDLSLREPTRFTVSRILGHQQLTDAYLLALAVAHDGCLVTIDGAVPLDAVPGATRAHVEVLAPDRPA